LHLKQSFKSIAPFGGNALPLRGNALVRIFYLEVLQSKYPR